MTYLTGHSSASAPAIELSAAQIGPLREATLPSANQKWPLWWTVLGVSVFCATFWTAFFSMIF